ncbi:Cytochrome c-type biogenesis protein CcmC [uncultured delta proteobacterium]|uniref:Heme exporter protein C n=1 Tax=uncultured delta proteobacterium TaxID=34034 RepID=A0A212JAF3_9DELT|nr:Cytochrome c-type biogenesis protein CcmC [uncultured delta proteobacterium]
MASPSAIKIPLPVALSLAGGVAMAAAQWLIFRYAPMEATMGMTQKIFYLHLPLAWWGLFSFFIVFIASIGYLRTRDRRWEITADAAAEIGVVLTALVLATGSIWAKAAWWRWWIWDHRLTTALIMWFVYAAYLVLRDLDMPHDRRAAAKAVLGVIAFLDVPIVFFATRLWESHHPVGTMTARDGLEPEMRLTVFACLAAFGLFWFGLLHLRRTIFRMEDALRAAREGAAREEQ